MSLDVAPIRAYLGVRGLRSLLTTDVLGDCRPGRHGSAALARLDSFGRRLRAGVPSAANTWAGSSAETPRTLARSVANEELCWLIVRTPAQRYVWPVPNTPEWFFGACPSPGPRLSQIGVWFGLLVASVGELFVIGS